MWLVLIGECALASHLEVVHAITSFFATGECVFAWLICVVEVISAMEVCV